MSDQYAEIPDASGRSESLGPVNRLNKNLYMAVIVTLSTVLLIGVIGWLILALNGRAMPEGLGVILGTVAGGLVGLVSDKSQS
jgi:hypothetical protein